MRDTRFSGSFTRAFNKESKPQTSLMSLNPSLLQKQMAEQIKQVNQLTKTQTSKFSIDASKNGDQSKQGNAVDDYNDSETIQKESE